VREGDDPLAAIGDYQLPQQVLVDRIVGTGQITGLGVAP
jgi:hypothetical protein